MIATTTTTTTATTARRGRGRAGRRISSRPPKLTQADLQLIAKLREAAKLSARLRLRQAGSAVEVDTSELAFDAALAAASANAAQDELDAGQDLARGPGRDE